MRQKLVQFCDQNGINSILDAPCGAFNWMQHVLSARKKGTVYTGVDIVRPLIIRNDTFFSNSEIQFFCDDITKNLNKYPVCDLLITRDFLFHFPFDDVIKFLNAVKDLNPTYFAVTNHPECKENLDTSSGGFRELNLNLSPICITTENACETIVDFVDGFPVRELLIFKNVADIIKV